MAPLTAPAALAGQDPEALYERLCALDGVRHDPCLLDVFTAIVQTVQVRGTRSSPCILNLG